MKPLVATLIGVLFLWMLACAWCGFHGRVLRFVAVALGGIALNILWMVVGLDADPLTKHALAAHAAAVLYALSSFAVGWLLSRILRQLRAK